MRSHLLCRQLSWPQTYFFEQGEPVKSLMAGIVPAVAACLASAAEAQVCAGFPTADREFTIGASTNFPEGLNPRGVEVSYNAPGPLSVVGGASVVSIENDEGILAESVLVGASYTLLGSQTGAGGQVCPITSLGYSWSDDLGTSGSLSVGLGLGANLSLNRTFGVYPYVAPQVVLSRASLDGDTETGADLGVAGGVMVGIGALWVGPSVTHVVESGADPVFGIRGGFRP
jgi:hypothetical protein